VKTQWLGIPELEPSLSGFLDKFASFRGWFVRPISSTSFAYGKIYKHCLGIEPTTYGVAVHTRLSHKN
jgi:hypothetical protein